MSTSRHGKIPDWYNKDSEHYDTFNETTSKSTNRTIEKILKQYKVKTVLDLTCGTGSQVFWLANRGYEVVGSDISLGMLKIAKQKAKNKQIKFLHGDMRTVQIGKFDAAITIFNAIGHLTKAGFEKAIRNIHSNLNEKGIYIFDIFNLSHLMHQDNISKLSIDWIRNEGKTKLREIQYSIIDSNGILISYTTNYVQNDSSNVKMSKSTGTLQLYTATELKDILARNGFKTLGQYGIDGSKFSEKKSERILTIAEKKS